MSDVSDQIGRLTSQIGELVSRIDSERTGKAGPAGDRVQAADAGINDLARQLTQYKEELRQENEKALKAALSNMRSPSMQPVIGNGAPSSGSPTAGRASFGVTELPHAALKASIRDYEAGELLTALLDAGSVGLAGIDIEAIQRGKAALADIGALWMGIPSGSKATLGTTGATGGYVLPNNLVDTLIKPNVQEAVYQTLIKVRTGVSVRGVDQPYRTGAPTRMQFQDWGSTKENVNEAYGSYTATLGTMARIYDIGKQYARFSAGSAEQDVLDELGKAAILGENYYILNGAGTGSVGTGDPTTGVYTALNSVFGAYTTAFTASSSTVAGSAAAGLASAFKSLASRSRRPTAVVVDAVTYWTLFSQGSDNAGFWMSELLGAGFQIGQDNALRWRGVPILYDANFDTNTSTTKRAIAADWTAFTLYRGMEFRVDTTDIAGTRWDQNLIGFRGEQEIGFNAFPGVFVGAAQLITGLIP